MDGLGIECGCDRAEGGHRLCMWASEDRRSLRIESGDTLLSRANIQSILSEDTATRRDLMGGITATYGPQVLSDVLAGVLG